MRAPLATGLLLGLVSALIGGAWQVATRHSTTTTIAPPDLALLRYGIPALLLLPTVWRAGLLPRGVPPRLIALMVLGAGLPFGLIAMSGTRFAPSTHMGVLMAGASPLFAAALAWLAEREQPSRARACGLLLMAAGVACLGAKALVVGGDGVWRGDLLFLLAALLWAGFTLSFRRSGLGAWQGAAIVNVWSALLLVPWTLARGEVHLFEAPLADVLAQSIWQGVVAGVLGVWTYTAAITRLGASNAAAFAALVPVVSALGGWWWLGDALTIIDAIAVFAAMIGVMLASGVLRRSWH